MRSVTRHQKLVFLGCFISLSSLLSGCMAPWFRPKASPNEAETRRDAIREKLTSENRPRLVRQVAVERQLTLSRLENLGLVSNLKGTGGAPRPGSQREKMLDMMRRNDVAQPNSVLDSNNTALIVAYSTIPPAASKGMRLNTVVKLSQKGEASDLYHGWLMETPLVEMSRLGGQIREGFQAATAEGALVTNAQVTGSETPESKLEAIVIGGTKLLKDRDLGLGVNSEYADAITMAAIIPAINNRFTVFDGHAQVGVATPVDNNYIKLAVPTRYRLDPAHYLSVVLNIGINETLSQEAERMESLRKQMDEPTTAKTACWQLEAIGEKAIPILSESLNHPNPEIRFYAAHALGYLNDARAVPVLTELSRREPAFRAMSINALTILDSFEAGDALVQLLHSADAETRYGAVLALRRRDPNDVRVQGEKIAESGSILEIPSNGPPCIAISLSETPEIVIFGEVPNLTLPTFHYVNSNVILQSNRAGGITISRFEAGKEDVIVESPNDLVSVLRKLTEVDCSYGDWVAFLRECSAKGYLMEQIALNPIPLAGRKYDRDTSTKLEPAESLLETTVISEIESPQDSSGAKSRWYNPMSWWES